MELKMAGATDVGLSRKSNQDFLYFDAAQRIAIVADGIGGRRGGDIASKMAVEGMRDIFLSTEMLRHEEIHTFLASAVDKVNQDIIAYGEKESRYKGMGTTLNFLMFVGDHVHIAHVGDSRTYLYYQGHLWQLTVDHNVETFLQRGWMPPSTVAPGTRDSALVRSLGLSGRCDVDIYDLKTKAGEVFITCSDGLSGMVEDKKILEIVHRHVRDDQLTRLPRALVEEANRNGGKDNITIVVSQVKDR